jgi:hypothetical protein
LRASAREVEEENGQTSRQQQTKGGPGNLGPKIEIDSPLE